MNKFLVLFFLMIIPFKGYPEEIRIELLPMGRIDKEILFFLKQKLPLYFEKTEVCILKEINIPSRCFNQRRVQYSAECILKELSSPDKGKVLGIIDQDLYTSGLNFIFGLATQDKALIAIRRLHNEFYGIEEDKNIFYLRVLKEANHELGHSFGLKHCSDPRCVMYFSNSLKDTDLKEENFCKRCKKVLDLLLKNAANKIFLPEE